MTVGEEMALGFTSDIAKNNLGESFYRRQLLNLVSTDPLVQEP